MVWIFLSFNSLTAKTPLFQTLPVLLYRKEREFYNALRMKMPKHGDMAKARLTEV